MDPIVAFNKERWEELSASNVRYSAPWLDLNKETARKLIDPEGQLECIEHVKVLCLAASGGQQSAAFGILGANVTVFDLSENQLAKDKLAAKHYGIHVETIQGDMQDLSVFSPEAFDVVWLAHSINFVPNASVVLQQIARICKVGGRVRINFTNPYVHGAWDCPSGNGFLISQPYVDGDQIECMDPYWIFADPDGKDKKVEGPKEYRHALSTIINSLIANRFVIKGLWEEIGTKPNPEIGSWEHFKRVAPPWLTIWVQKHGKS
jgi:SAM-dependent methyltransferase